MNPSKRYIPVLITVALLSLIGLQVVWLFLAYRNAKEDLKENTREAVLETAQRLQQQKDARLIVNSMDSLLVTDNVINDSSKKKMRIVVSNIRKSLMTDTLQVNNQIEREIHVVNDSSNSTTVIKIGSDKNQKVIIGSQSRINNKTKAAELETLFLKMAAHSSETRKSIDARVDSHEIRTILKEELLNRGINLIPEFGVSFFPKNNKPGNINYHVVVNTSQYVHILPAMITLPLFQRDITEGALIIKVGYLSAHHYVIKQMAGLLALSLFITLLIGYVIIFIFRRLLSQEKLHKIKNDFINNMTHELKTPIATISLALEAINNPLIRNDTEKFKNYSRILKEENGKLNSHVERVLQMALLEKGELHLNKQRVDLAAVITTVIKNYTLQIEKQRAKILFHDPATSVFINGDEDHLSAVFSNLIDNALKYSNENCIIEITLSQQADNALIIFKDNGIGIDAPLKDKVFEKFFRVQGGNLHDVKGFGLGLSYVASIVKQHGGSIELISEKGRGSEFILKFKTDAI
ncbi:MAG: two-component sensor histidine kinase [Bacteroidetes bacterium]|nr:two-component sensor histidine kinase [Bacteroidota bacterium]